ncbi:MULTISPECIES: AMP-binding protein [Hydrogenophaga]|uniref:AMP-dependent synthetase and ligase n=1 Tax=Hydrogenophaga intermedia TaxID=65786 RepID=A0A1L1PQK0_HYDIT|nr:MULTISPECIES: AMP-binding protein [Hydrogenophaga]AOS81621.1 AMP-dependent synthetase [Hydrogenophaga sp. PBC]TMU71114.1 ATP-dependent acyl-CoA ligase [Hydrogenophaga intermedia]CDN89197.1 AMP-dependent synthetase and ligase [Hydrogenophaga intermedia]
MNHLSTVPLAQLISERRLHATRDPLLTFVRHLPDGGFSTQHRDYAQLWERGQALARALLRAGLQPGDRFAILMQNHAEFVDAVVASSIAGTVFVPIDPRTRGKKLQYMLDAVACKGVVVGDYCLDALTEALPEVPRIGWIWVVGDGASGQRPLPAPAAWLERVIDPHGEPVPCHPVRPDTPMQLVFTSGTTGDPKAIIGSYAKYAGACAMVAACGVTPDDRMYTGLSLTHSNALAITLGGSLYLGVPAVFSRKFTKSGLWHVIRHFGCTTLNLLGGMFSAIYSEAPDPRDADNPLRMVIGSGMPLNLWAPFSQRFGVQIAEVYGAAEGGATVNKPGEGPPGSIGRPLPGLVARVMDKTDRECAPDEPGEIVFRHADGTAPEVRYWNNPQASAEKTRGGWLRMGDVGYRDRNGWLFFMHRLGNEIRRNGDFISPGFVEKEIAEHPDVADVFVYGVSASTGVPGEKDLVAAIVARQPHAWNAAELFAFCQQRLERNSVPSYLQLVEQIPKTASEKPLERVLAKAFRPDAANVFVIDSH